MTDQLNVTFTEPGTDRPILFRFRVDQADTHVHVRMFAGRSEHSLGLCGRLVLRAEEWAALSCALTIHEHAAKVGRP